MIKNAKGIAKGFTLIELVIVIVILGILAAVALPRFLDLTGVASKATVEGVAGALSSASSSNYGAKMAKVTDAANVTACEDAAGLLLGGTLPGTYAITAASISGPNGTVKSDCVVTGENGQTANFTAIYVT